MSLQAPSPPAAVVFDCDGLLLDTESAWTRADVALYSRYGTVFTLSHKHELLGTSRETTQALLAAHLDRPGDGAALQQELHELFFGEISRAAPPLPGACELLVALRASQMPIAVASNSPRAHLERAIESSGLAGAFDLILCAEDVARPKPAPDIYLQSSARLGVASERCVALEDSRTGVASARAAGMYVIGVPSVDGIVLDDADLQAASLTAPAVWEALGLCQHERSANRRE